MKLKDEKPSKNVYHAAPRSAGGKTSRQDIAVAGNSDGKRSRIYEGPEYKKAIKDVSQTFQDKVKGKSNREDKAISIMADDLYKQRKKAMGK